MKKILSLATFALMGIGMISCGSGSMSSKKQEKNCNKCDKCKKGK